MEDFNYMPSLASIFPGWRILTEEAAVSMAKALHYSGIWPSSNVLHLSWNAKAITKDSTLASILKSPLQGQEPIYIQDDGQPSYGLLKGTQSIISRNWLRIPIVIISPPYLPMCRTPSGHRVSMKTHLAVRDKGTVSDWLLEDVQKTVDWLMGTQ